MKTKISNPKSPLGEHLFAPNFCLALSLAAAATLVGSSAHAVDYTWNQTGATANWNVKANWSPSTSFPTSAGAGAILNTALTANQAITLGQTITVGRIDVGATTAFKYTIGTAGATINFNNNGAGAQINVLSTSQGDSIASNVALQDNLTVSNASANTFTLNAAVSGSGGITLSQGGLKLNGVNTYSGDTVLTLGTLNVTNTKALQNSVLQMNGGVFSIGPVTALTIGGLAGSTDLNLVNTSLAAVNLTFGNSNASTGLNTLNPTYSGVIGNSRGTASLTKVGTNTQTLSGANTYTGATTISAGELDINGSLAATSAVSVASSATLGGSGTVNGSVTVTDGTIHGNGLTLKGSTSFTGASTLAGTSTATSGYTVTSGTLSVTGTTTSNVLVTSGILQGSGSVGNVATSGTLAGTLSTGAISGSGAVSPGNSPGILTSTSADVSTGLDFNFEFTLANTAPYYDVAAASGNDILNLTSVTPFSGNLDSNNVINIYLSGDTVGSTYLGGFFTSLSASALATAIEHATVNYYVLAASGIVSYNGQSYNSLNASALTLTTEYVTGAAFTSGTVNGSELLITVVPEPTTWAMVVGGLGMLIFVSRFRIGRGGVVPRENA